MTTKRVRPQKLKSDRQTGAERDAYRRSLVAAATKVPSQSQYRRKPKHTGRGWSDD